MIQTGRTVIADFYSLSVVFAALGKNDRQNKKYYAAAAKAALCANPSIHTAAIVASRPISGGASSAGICEIYNVSLTLCSLNLYPTRGKIRTDRRAIGHANHLS
jgi:hypothetical protein